MLRITKIADYGFVLLTHMARDPENPSHNARDLAKATRLPLPMVSKILKAMVKGDLLASRRGVYGGYALARPPLEITVRQIIAALDGPIAITECVHVDESGCEIQNFCPVRGNWQRINEAIVDALDGITLAEMCGSFGTSRFKGAPRAAATEAGVS